MKRTKDELLDMIKNILPDDTTDDALSLIEDITDTFETEEDKDKTDWKQKYVDNDKEWRQRYRDRFFSPKGSDSEQGLTDPEDEPEEKRNFSDLFKEE